MPFSLIKSIFSSEKTPPAPLVATPVPGQPAPLSATPTKADLKLRKDQEKAAEKSRKEAEKAETKEKERVAAEAKAQARRESSSASDRKKQSKVDEKAELKQLKAERDRGSQAREEVKDNVTNQGADYFSTLSIKFQNALDEEKMLFGKLTAAQKSPEEAMDLAYRTIWLDTKDEELRGVRPPRETAAERLMYVVHQMRLDNQIGTRDEDGNVLIKGEDRIAAGEARGQTVSKAWETLYEQWAEEVYEETHHEGKLLPGTDAALIDAQVGERLLAANAELAAKRPDPRVEYMAREAAGKRVLLGITAKKEKSGLEDADKKLKTVNGKVMPVVGGVAKGAAGATKSIGKLAGDKGTGPDEGDQARLVTRGIEDKMPLGLGSAITAGKTANVQVATNTRSNTAAADAWDDKATSVHAASGITSLTGAIGSMLKAVKAVISVVRAVGDSTATSSHFERLEVAKTMVGGVQSLGNAGKSIANFTKAVDPSTAAVVMAQVIPGLNIATSITSLANNAMTLAQHGIRMQQTNTALDDARSTKRSPGSTETDVMVWPLWHMQQGYVKTMESSIMDTSISMVTVASNIATVATAGGFGIPAAINASTSLLAALHSAGHTIAEQVLVRLAKKAKDARTGHLEGGAVDALRREPAMAVDAIVAKARGGDQTAIGYLTNFGFDQDTIKTGQLSKFRDKILGEIGEDENPQYLYEQYQDKLTGESGFLTKMSKVSELAKDRDADEAAGGGSGKSRGRWWKFKMFVESVVKEDDFNKSVAKTEALKQGNRYVVVRVGKSILMEKASAKEVDTFVDTIAKGLKDGTITLQTLSNVINHPDTSDGAQRILAKIVSQHMFDLDSTPTRPRSA